MTPDLAITVALRRAAVYRLLAVAFAYPTAPRLESVAMAAWEAAVTAPPELRVALRRLADAAAGADETGLAAEHVALFQRQVRCPPYEGAYGPPQMAGKAPLLADVAGFYRAFALEPAEGQPEVEDHVCAELEFMSALAVKEAYAVGEAHSEGLAVTRAAEATFLRDHLGCWATAFAAGVQAATPLPFYVAAAELLAAWVSAELEAFGVDPACAAEPDTAADEEPFTCPMAPSTEAEGDHP